MEILIVTCVIVLIVFILRYYFRNLAPLRPKENRFEYVYVENDGTVREIDFEDQKYLNTKFDNADGNRPYIKSRYSQLTPDGKMSGFILRVRVPKHFKINAL